MKKHQIIHGGEEEKMYTGIIHRAKVYPVALPSTFLARVYKREHSWLGRLRNDFECWLLRRIFDSPTGGEDG